MAAEMPTPSARMSRVRGVAEGQYMSHGLPFALLRPRIASARTVVTTRIGRAVGVRQKGGCGLVLVSCASRCRFPRRGWRQRSGEAARKGRLRRGVKKRRPVTARLGRAQRRRLAHCGREKEAFEITERARGTLKTGPCPERQKLSRAGRGSDFAYSERARKARIFARTSGVSKALPPWPAPGRTWNSEGTPTSRRRAWRRSLWTRGTWSSWSP